MSLLDVGANCALPTCKRLDFLPFKCDSCAKVFCDEHFRHQQHGCASPIKDNQVPVCPMCNLPVPIGPSENPNIVMNRHIDSNCRRAAGTGKGTTALAKNKCVMCDKTELTPIVCKKCGDTFCLSHRFESDHKCEERIRNKRLAKFQISTPDFPSNFKFRFMPPSNKFSNTKATAVGDANVASDKRLLLAVQFPQDSPLQQAQQWMFFDGSMKVGRAIDVIAKQSRVVNENNKVPNEQRLKLYGKDGLELETSKSLIECGLKPENRVILERGHVMQAIREATASSSSTGHNDCVMS
eukprot:c23439_g1_i1.p1 GENE.c23439_g1_i1~~c23439_g1_i1.p1  ORF type:complete len:326 (+),score=57.18 c23439_g1_i1:92-979(+)